MSLAGLLLLLARSAGAVPGEGTSGALLARVSVGARGQALGGAHAGLPGAPEAFLANPAALARVDGSGASAAFHLGAEDLSYGALAAVHPVLPWLGAGLALQTLAAGTIEAHDYAGNLLTARLEDDLLATAGCAARAGPVGLGVAVKAGRSTLIGTEHASFFAGDLGADVRLEFEEPEGPPPWPAPAWMRLGFAVANLGPRVRFGTAAVGADDAPLAFRLGASLGKPLSPEMSLLGVLAVTMPRATTRAETFGGLEVARTVNGVVLAARAGFR
ncbi:MAG: hypothetical protein AAB368_10915, partial [bacterium]